MSYTAITIKDAVKNVLERKYILPSIQREFVWDTDQIEKLFDSIMRGYPIGSFLLWEVGRHELDKWEFYQFIENYHQRTNRNNSKAETNGVERATAVLDGQQRLTALYIGLNGSFAYKTKHKRQDDPQAYPKRRLYLNLLSDPAGHSDDLLYQFKFLREDDNKEGENGCWFLVGKVLNFRELADVRECIDQDFSTERYNAAQLKLMTRNLERLFEHVCRKETINYFLESNNDLDRVLDIFVRVNSGGTPLSHSDLLLAMASAKWDIDAREEIIGCVKEIEARFEINKDFVLKSCLALTDSKVAFRFESFDDVTLTKIEKQWLEIKKAIVTTVDLVADLGYERDTLTSNNALIPIAYYVHKIGIPADFRAKSQYQIDRERIAKYLRSALLKRIFSGQSDNVLAEIIAVIKRCKVAGFPLVEIVSQVQGTNKRLTFDDDDIDALLDDCHYDDPYSYSVLAVVYPTLDFSNKFHKDHIFPKKLFKKKILKERGIAEEDVDFYMVNVNSIANLQLLAGTPNREKSDTDFSVWLERTYDNAERRRDYLYRNLIPDLNDNYDLANFKKFVFERRKLIAAEFKKLVV